MNNITKRSAPTKAICNRIYEWCIKKYGRSKFNGPYPKLKFTKYFYVPKGKNPLKYYADYQPWDNLITINRNVHRTVYQLIDSIIHEWIHYMQPIKSHINKETNKEKVTFKEYISDPIEAEAIATAKRDRNICFNELFKK